MLDKYPLVVALLRRKKRSNLETIDNFQKLASKETRELDFTNKNK